MKRTIFLIFASALLRQRDVNAEHHMNRRPPHWVNKRNSEVPLRISNRCGEDIYPAIQTQSGVGPAASGFRLPPGGSNAQTVSADWQGRIWGRTNCSFNAQGTAPANDAPGQACTTGDCGGTVACRGAGRPPATLAEFTLETGDMQTVYDTSLVDGYNLPLGIISLFGSGSGSGGSSSSTVNDSNNSDLTDIPPNLTNSICIGTSALLDPAGLPSKSDGSVGSNITYPLPVERALSASAVSSWCPWDLQLSPPQKPGDGVYPYPDDAIARPAFQACYSACAKWSEPRDCCTGAFDSAATCGPSLYSDRAKEVCPDAYSYAFDDRDSTFVIPSGGGFELVFCPRGRSTTILTVFRSELHELVQAGRVTQRILDEASGVGVDKADLAVEPPPSRLRRRGSGWSSWWRR